MPLWGCRHIINEFVFISQLLAHIRRTHHDGLIWGCRHLINGKDCLKYTRSKARLLADKHEPVVQEVSCRLYQRYKSYTL